jgi:hypothetical protein
MKKETDMEFLEKVLVRKFKKDIYKRIHAWFKEMDRKGLVAHGSGCKDEFKGIMQ